MKGKIGIVVGLAAGYVLGARAGQERYEQIKEGFLKVWNTDPVQKQVGPEAVPPEWLGNAGKAGEAGKKKQKQAKKQ